jgi:protease I
MLRYDSEPGWDTYVERPGHSVEANVALTALVAKDFGVLLILGGRAPEYLRNDPSVLALAREFAAQNKCIGAIGHGIQSLAKPGPGWRRSADETWEDLYYTYQ